MKKLSLVLVILLAFGASIFADDAAEVTMPTVEEAAAAIDDLATVKGLLSPSVSGSGTLTWGLNLDEMTTGFTNAEASDLVITLVPEADASSGTIGVITISDYKLCLSPEGGVTGSDGSVSAKLVFGPLSVAVYSAPTVTADIAAYNVVATTNPAGGGTTITYAMDTMSFALQVASDGDWDANTENTYALGVVADVTVSVLNLDVEFAYNLGSTNMGFATGVTVDLDPIEITAAFDGAMDADTDFAYDMTAGVSFAGPNDTCAGLTYAMNSIATDGMKIGVSFTEDGTVDEGYVGVLGASVGFNLTLATDTTDMTWDASASVDYDAGTGLSPDAAFTYNSAGTMTLTAGCDFGSALTGFDNTTIALDYGTLTIADGVDPVLGDVTVAVTVAY